MRAADQAVRGEEERAAGFVRRSVSPPHAGPHGELVEGRLTADADPAARTYPDYKYVRAAGL